MKGLLLFGALLEAAAFSLFGVMDESSRSGHSADLAVLALLCAGLFFGFFMMGRGLGFRETAVAAAALAVIGAFVYDFLGWNFFPLLAHDVDPLGFDHLEGLARLTVFLSIPSFGCALAALLLRRFFARRSVPPPRTEASGTP